MHAIFRHDYLPSSGGTSKYAKAPSTKKKTLRDSLPIDMLISAVYVLVVAQSSSEVPEGLMNNSVFILYHTSKIFSLHLLLISKKALQ